MAWREMRLPVEVMLLGMLHGLELLLGNLDLHRVGDHDVCGGKEAAWDERLKIQGMDGRRIRQKGL